MINTSTVAPVRRRRQPRPVYTVGQRLTISRQPWGGNITVAATIERITPTTYHLRTDNGSLKLIPVGELSRRIREVRS